jgi:hypothetical protein
VISANPNGHPGSALSRKRPGADPQTCLMAHSAISIRFGGYIHPTSISYITIPAEYL